MIKARVIGCGVIGLTVARLLSQKGWSVEVVYEANYTNTTSYIAAAVWHPFLVEKSTRILKWAEDSYKYFECISNQSNTGVSIVKGQELSSYRISTPEWASILKNFHITNSNSWNTVWSYEAPVIEMPQYLSWLKLECLKNNVIFKQQKINNILKNSKDFDCIINSSGMGSKKLNIDKKLFPIRGQVCWIKKPNWLNDFCIFHLEDEVNGYIIPRKNDAVIGTTAQKNDLCKEPRKKDANFILNICKKVNPKIQNIEIESHHVGHRPAREKICNSVVVQGDVILGNLYGHGGSGVTLSWGSALSFVKKLENKI